jgi:hypothetical protein
MAAPTGAFVVKNATVTLESIAYANQCTKAKLVPDVPIQSVRTLVPDGAVQDTDSAIWTFEITALQINESGGLAKALRDATPGDELDVVLAPQAGSGKPQATFVIKALPVQFGDDQGKFAMFEAALPVVGQPVFGTVS